MVYPIFFELAAVVARLCASRTVALVVFDPALLSPGIALTKGMPALAALGALGFNDLHQAGHGTTCSNFSSNKSSCHRCQSLRTKYRQLRTNSTNCAYKLARVESLIKAFSDFQSKI